MICGDFLPSCKYERNHGKRFPLYKRVSVASKYLGILTNQPHAVCNEGTAAKLRWGRYLLGSFRCN
jgi:hypothetical protein